jgi:hypothetical protein
VQFKYEKERKKNNLHSIMYCLTHTIILVSYVIIKTVMMMMMSCLENEPFNYLLNNNNKEWLLYIYSILNRRILCLNYKSIYNNKADILYIYTRICLCVRAYMFIKKGQF